MSMVLSSTSKGRRNPNNASCFAFVRRNVGKGAFIIGVGGATGEVYINEGGEAKKVGKSDLVQASAGWSLGVQVATEIIFFENKEAFDRFTTGTFEFEAGAKCSVLTLGADSTARTTGTSEATTAGMTDPGSKTKVATDTGYTNGMATFMALKMGLMVDVSVGGQKFFYKAAE